MEAILTSYRVCTHQLDFAIFRDEQVGTLDVAVADTLRMQPLKTDEHLPDVHAYQVLGEGTKVFDQCGERAILDILQDKVKVGFGTDGLEVAHDQIML